MDRYSRARVIVCLFFATALAERMTDLDDIERDNLRAEVASSTESGRPKEAQYVSTADPTSGQPDYQQPRRYQSEDRASGYAAPRQDKYSVRAEGFERGPKYSENEVGYQEAAGAIQRYGEYDRQRQVVAEVPNGRSHAPAYEPQQRLFYRPEVALGNQYQTALQKEATEKYADINGEPLYFSIPMSQLLSYYPNLSAVQPTISKGEGQPHRLASDAARNIVIPIYAPPQSREPIYAHSKVAYRIQPHYSSSDSKYQQHTDAILPTKRPSKLIYAQNVLTHRRPQAQPDRYLHEIVYAQPGAIYAPELSPSHADVRPPRPSVHLRGNGPDRSHAAQTRHRQQYASYTQPETYYALQAANIASRLTDQLYQHQSAENALQNYETIPEPPTSEHDLPRLPAQNFKSGPSLQLVSVPNESEDSHYSQNHLDHSSEPRSLLDSYVPSQLIAAQDSERYRERPIRLERGFLPSKIDFVQSHKKRNAE